jgi:hypothetical protein
VDVTAAMGERRKREVAKRLEYWGRLRAEKAGS